MKENNTLLPKNRREQFKILLKENVLNYFFFSLFASIFVIPLFVWFFFSSYADLFDGLLFYKTLYTYLIALPLFLFASLGFAGLDYYLQKQIYNEGVSFLSTFFEGISKNFKEYLLSFTCIWMISFLLRASVGYFSSDTQINEYLRVVFTAIMYVLYFFFLFVFLRSNIESLTYKGSFLTHLKNSLIFTFGKPHVSIGIALFAYLPLLLFEAIPMYESQMVLLFVEAFFYLVFGELIMVLSSDYFFDLTLNKDYPEMYRKGLKND